MSYSELSEQFVNAFEIHSASTHILKDVVYRMRYQVYCAELSYEDSKNFPTQRERDRFDTVSSHCLLKHKKSGLWAGCVRLVLPTQNLDHANFPCEQYFGSLSSKIQSIQSVGEVSRLAVPASFRRRKGEESTAHGIPQNPKGFTDHDRRQFPLIPMSLYLAATAIALDKGLDSAVTVMEPRLARHLRYFGIHFEQISDLLHFNGKRALFIISRVDLLDKIRPDCYELLKIIGEQLNNNTSEHQMYSELQIK